MANHKSAEKRARQNEKRRGRNAALKSSLRTVTKKFMAAVAAGSKDEAQALLGDTCRAWDKGVSKNVVHPNTAARKKSRMTHHVLKLQAGASAAKPTHVRRGKKADLDQIAE